MSKLNVRNSPPMSQTLVRTIKVRTILQPTRQPPPAPRWSADAYQGCDNGCWHCGKRAPHELPAHPHGGFQHQVYAKVNAAQILARELTRRSWKRAPVILGVAADPYQPTESTYRLTRQMIEVLLAYRTPLVINTRSHLVLEDLELLSTYAQKLPLTVTVPVATIEDALLAVLEPGVDSAQSRLRTVAHMASAGIQTGVRISPVFPGLNDSRDQIEAAARQAAAVGARHFATEPLLLDRNGHQFVMPFFEERFPGLYQAYRSLYRHGKLQPRMAARIQALGREIAAAYHLEPDLNLRPTRPPAPPVHQLSLYGFSSA